MITTGGTEQTQWRPMTSADLDPVGALADRVHVHYPERRDVLAAKLRLFPQGCFVLPRPALARDADAASGLGGYCFSHPWTRIVPPALDTVLDALPARPSTYFIHDLTLTPRLRGRGHASALLSALFAMSRTIAGGRLSLIAVSGSDPFWRRAGFERTPDNALQALVRGKYGPKAIHMTQRLDEKEAGP